MEIAYHLRGARRDGRHGRSRVETPWDYGCRQDRAPRRRAAVVEPGQLMTCSTSQTNGRRQCARSTGIGRCEYVVQATRAIPRARNRRPSPPQHEQRQSLARRGLARVDSKEPACIGGNNLSL